MPAPLEVNYLLFSDVHLGADLVHHLRPWTRERLEEVHRVDHELATMLEHYREQADPARPWRVIIAGDFVDFIGMSIGAPGEDLVTALNLEERVHGLGSASDHAATKMHAIVHRHGRVFDALADLVADGHTLVMIRGNHDLDFHWPAVQVAFVDALSRRRESAYPEVDGDAFRARVEFHPWFYYVEGLLYVEHGHQFDPMCMYPNLLAPVRPADPSRLHWTFSDLLLRLVALPTPGLGGDQAGQRTMMNYLRFAFSIGTRGLGRLAVRYVKAVGAALRSAREHVGEAAAGVREEHERGMNELARERSLERERLERLADLWPSPVTRGTLPLLRSVFFDRVLIAFALLMTLALLPLAGVSLLAWSAAALGLIAAFVVYCFVSSPIRRPDVDPIQTMVDASARIGEVMPARYVVMGHCHSPCFDRVADDTTYVNLGFWSEGEVREGDERAGTRTHLVLRWKGGELEAELRRWDSKRGALSL